MITAILTGDIIGSTKIEQRYRPMLNKAMYSLVEDFSTVSADVKFEIFRGDSFQMEIKEVENAVKFAVLYRAGLRAATPLFSKKTWDARISIGIGEVYFSTDNLKTSDGEAFHYSGHGLDEIGKKKLSIRTPWKDVDEELELLTEFADDIISGWTIKQSEVVFQKILTNKTQKEIAILKNQEPANISTMLSKARENLISKYIRRSEILIREKLKDRA